MTTRCRRRGCSHGRSAVTLLELLTVIAIIALLLSILLPSMAGTWRTSQRVACMNNLRELARGAALYGLNHDGWISGAPSGSGAYLYQKGVAFGPAVQRWDFLGPVGCSTCIIPPEFDLTVAPAWGGAFSDAGLYSTFSRSWDRSRAPGNGDTGPVDARKYAFRHSLAEPPVGAPGNAFLLNLAFYDGHVETMGDLDASHPKLWLPAGTVVTPTSSVLWPDAIEHFGLPSQYTVPR